MATSTEDKFEKMDEKLKQVNENMDDKFKQLDKKLEELKKGTVDSVWTWDSGGQALMEDKCFQDTNT